MSPNKANNDKQTQLLSTSGPQIQPLEKSGGLGAPANNTLKSVLFEGTGMQRQGPRQREARVSQEVQGPIRTRCRLERTPLLYRPNAQMQQPGEKMRNKTALRNILPLHRRMCSFKAESVPRNTFLKRHQMFQEHSELVKLETRS